MGIRRYNVLHAGDLVSDLNQTWFTPHARLLTGVVHGTLIPQCSTRVPFFVLIYILLSYTFLERYITLYESLNYYMILWRSLIFLNRYQFKPRYQSTIDSSAFFFSFTVIMIDCVTCEYRHSKYRLRIQIILLHLCLRGREHKLFNLKMFNISKISSLINKTLLRIFSRKEYSSSF